MAKPHQQLLEMMERNAAAVKAFTVAGAIIMENENDTHPDYEFNFFRNTWSANRYQTLAMRQIIRLPDEKFPEPGPGPSPWEWEVLRKVREEFAEHFRTGIIFVMYAEREDINGIQFDAVYWGDRLSALGLLEVWKRRYDADTVRANVWHPSARP